MMKSKKHSCFPSKIVHQPINVVKATIIASAHSMLTTDSPSTVAAPVLGATDGEDDADVEDIGNDGLVADAAAGTEAGGGLTVCEADTTVAVVFGGVILEVVIPVTVPTPEALSEETVRLLNPHWDAYSGVRTSAGTS